MSMLPEEVPAGALVYTSDGYEAGRVDAVEGPCFRLDARLQPDYWLSRDTIAGMTEGVLRLRFTRQELNDARPTDPSEHIGLHLHP
jgi:hypothetical protein